MSSKEQSQFSFQKITFHLIGVLNTPHSPRGDTRETERSLFQAVWRRLLSSRNQTLLDRTSDSKVMPQPGESPLVPTPPTEHRAHWSPRCSCAGAGVGSRLAPCKLHAKVCIRLMGEATPLRSEGFSAALNWEVAGKGSLHRARGTGSGRRQAPGYLGR